NFVDNPLPAAIVVVSGLVTIINSTIVENQVNGPHIASSGVGSPFDLGGTIKLQNTILAFNVPDFSGNFRDCEGPITSLGNNIIGSILDCSINFQPSDLITDPKLGPFTQNNKGEYYPLLLGSPAIDSANPTACLATDQLGNPRLGVCDRGSVEFQDGRLIVSVDIRPRSDANKINPHSIKNINVAIFSVNGF